MTDTWDLWLWLTLGLLALVWAASALSGWYVARRRRQMRDFVRGWDSRQDFAHRVAERRELGALCRVLSGKALP